MRPPRSFKVLGQRYNVEVVKPSDPPIVVNGHTGYVGSHHRTSLDVQVLAVGPEFAPHQQIEAFLHEAIHAVMSHGRFVHYLSGDDDEPFVDAFTPQLLDFLRSNPSVVAYLTEKVE